MINQLDQRVRAILIADGVPARATFVKLPYLARSRCATEPVSADELVRSLIHMAHRRGFKSNKIERDSTGTLDATTANRGKRSAKRPETLPAVTESASNDKEGRDKLKKKQLISLLEVELEKSGETLGQRLARIDAGGSVSIRAKVNAEIKFATSRKMYADEFRVIIERQQKHHQWLTAERIEALRHLILDQLPLKRGRQLRRCPLEHRWPPAPKAELAFQRFRMLMAVNNLSWVDGGGVLHKLSEVQFSDARARLLTELEGREEMDLDDVASFLGLPAETKLSLARGSAGKIYGDFSSVKMRKSLGASWDAWDRGMREKVVAAVALGDGIDLIVRRLQALGLNESQQEDALKGAKGLEEGFAAYSRRALVRLSERVAKGDGLWEAKDHLYGRQLRKCSPQHRLPPLNDKAVRTFMGPVTSPSAIRALTRVRKVVNGLLAKYRRQTGDADWKPRMIRVELARVLALTPRQRMELTFDNARRRKLREEAKRRIEKEFGVPADQVSDIEAEREQLWNECGGVCVYCGGANYGGGLMPKPKAILGTGDFQVDHIVPRSRGGDSGPFNKVLCCTKCNREKSGDIPWKAFGERDESRWSAFATRVTTCHRMPARKQQHLLCTSLPEGFNERDLRDTATNSRLAVRYLSMLYGGETEPGFCPQVATVKARFTSKLRAAWSLGGLLSSNTLKTRDDHRHHAIDATITALATPKELHRLQSAMRDEERRGSNAVPTLQAPIQIRDQLQIALSKVIVAPAVVRKLKGPLHADTQSPKADEESKAVRFEKSYHRVRRSICALRRDEIEHIADRSYREQVDAIVGDRDPREVFAKPRDSVVLKARNGQTRRLKHITLHLPKSAQTITRAYETVGNAFLEIVSKPSKTLGRRWAFGRVISRFEALGRLRQREPLFGTNLGRGVELVHVIRPGDVFEVGPDGARRIVEVASVSRSEIQTYPVEDARPRGASHPLRSEGRISGAGPWQKLKPRRVTITPIGEVVPEGEPRP